MSYKPYQELQDTTKKLSELQAISGTAGYYKEVNRLLNKTPLTSALYALKAAEGTSLTTLRS